MPVAHQQLVRQKPPALSVTRQGLQLRQSLQLVQIMLHASLGTLFYLREFLPLSCFGDRDLLFLKTASPAPEPDEPLNPLTDAVSYDAFLRADKQSCSSRAHSRLNSRRGQPLKVILRGKHEKADKILDLLENGIFSALSQNLLDAVQITVFADPKDPSNVLETYTFSFTYVDPSRDDMTSRLASINLNANGSTTEITASRVSARNGIEMIIRRLITLSTFLPRLPKNRFMEIHLFHRHHCPPDYSPPGFQSAPESQLNDSLYYPEDENWTPETQTCGSANTGHHTVGLKITSMKYRGTNTTLSDNEDGPIEVPTNVGYSKGVPRERDIEIGEPNRTSPSLTQQLDNATERKSQDTLSATNISQLSTQARQDQQTKHILQKMILPSTPASDIVPTQVNADDLRTLIDDDEEDTQILRPEISQADLARLAKVQGETQSNPRHPTTTNGENEVACQCGWKEKDSNEKMLCCSFCNKLQHPICYGFLHGEDPSIPATHSCYHCLLDPVAEVHTLRELSTLAMLRQALKVIVERGYPNRVSEFGTMLHCNGHTVIQITDILRRQGFLVATPGSRSKGFASTGLPKYRIPFSVKMRERLRREIFNPLLKIEHHYVIPNGTQVQTTCATTSLRRRDDQQNQAHQIAASTATSNVRALPSTPLTELPERAPKRLNSQACPEATTPRLSTRETSAQVKRRKLSCLRSPISIGGIMSDEIDDELSDL